MNREAIHAALFTKLSTVADFKTKSRRLKFFDEIASIDQPAFFLVWVKDEVEQDEYSGVKITLRFEAWIYVNSGQDPAYETVKDVIVIMDAIHAALAPVGGDHRQSIGGLVYSCTIDGTVETDGGALGGQSFAIVPIKVVTTD